MSSTVKYAIIVAGGVGQRMGSKIPKQFLELKGRPILIRTIEAYKNYSAEIEVILVLPDNCLDRWNSICDRYNFNTRLSVVTGGATRFQSVRNGLKTIKPGGGLVAIHDGVRPLVDHRIIQESFETAERFDSAVAVIPLKDSIRQVTPTGSQALDRQQYRIVQTPQTFKTSMIQKAYEVEESPAFTDDASVWEAVGYEIKLFKGSEKNLKITTVGDLLMAEVFMKL